MPQDYNYTAADFERYHSGRMSEAEMHALEKAALKDPFLSDALEGYTYTDSPVKDIAALKERLSGKKDKKKGFFISKQDPWLRIAALFVLIAGIGYLAYQLDFTEKTSMLATKQDSVLKNAAEQSITPKTDSSLIKENKDIVAGIPLAKNNEKFLNTEDKLTARDMKITRDEPGESSANPVRENLQKSVRSNAQPDVSYLQDNNFMRDKNILKGRVLDSLGNPVRYATISAKDINIATRSDSAGRFQLFAKDSSVMATVSALGYKTKEKKLSDKSEQVIVIENDNKALNEVVVTAPAMQQRKASISARVEYKVPGVTMNKSASEPVGGLQKFNEYVKKNIRVPADKDGNNYKGTVVLSFEINNKGTPKRIKVAQSFCKPCNEEAIRLLKAGPKWKYTNSTRQYVAIEF